MCVQFTEFHPILNKTSKNELVFNQTPTNLINTTRIIYDIVNYMA